MGRRVKSETSGWDIRHELLGIVLLAAGGLCLASLVGEGAGLVGGFLFRVIRTTLGEAAWMVPVLLGVAGFAQVAGRGAACYQRTRVGGVALAVVAMTATLHLRIPLEEAFAAGRAGEAGGVVGASASWLLGQAFGDLGRRILLAFAAVAALLLVVNRPLVHVGRGILGALRAVFLAAARVRPQPEVRDTRRRRASVRDEAAGGTVVMDEADAVSGPQVRFDEPQASHTPAAVAPPPAAAGKRSPAADQQQTAPSEPEQVAIADDLLYRVPDLGLLNAPSARRSGRGDRDLAARARRLEHALANFGIEARVVGTATGPAVTRFEMEPAPGVKISRITGLADDIALAMASSDVRVAAIPGRGLVGIEVPNSHISPVLLREVLESDDFVRSRSKLAIGLGKDIAGRPIVTDLERMLHLLIAGATGSGKSICINAIVASILFKARPSEVKLLMVDPKRVELSGYDGIPHLLAPVVTDAKQAASCLRWAVREMERRYEVFADLGVRDIYRHNELLARGSGVEGMGPLPHLVVIIDELADLMSVAPVDVEDAIQRLAQMARAAGIHLVVATQRPSVDVITGVIKANIPSRIAFAVSSAVDSRTILDTGGAEKLLGKGDMLFAPVGAAKPMRVQGSYVSEVELESLLSLIRSQASPDFDPEIVNLAPDDAGDGFDDDDEMVMKALELLAGGAHASVSGLQRRLRIGYTRAGRVIDILERQGYVGPHQGSKPRDVYITRDEFERLRASRQE